MASNGYERWHCDQCLCFANTQDGRLCKFRSSSSPDFLKFVSAYDYDHFPELRSFYDEPCPHFIDREFVLEKFRSGFPEFFAK